jgi:indole-3-glycerol phosphate synthase
VDTILDQIIAYKRGVEVPERMQATPLAAMRQRAATGLPPRDFVAALRAVPGVALVAEVKRASPSRGVLRADFDPVHLAETYAGNGAVAVSVLTDTPYFQGELEHLTRIRAALPVPLLRKDFVVHPYQVYEARAAGADAVLLIAGVLDDAELAGLMALAADLGMAALVEVHTAAEVARVLPLRPSLVGINNRDLRDFSVRLETCLQLRAHVPPDVCCVAESGIQTASDVTRLRVAGLDAMLVGEALITAPDVAARVRELVYGQD